MGAENHLIENAYGGKVHLDARSHRWVNVAGLMMPPMLHRTQAAPFQHGATWLATVLQPRDIILNWFSRTCDRRAMFDLRDAFSRVINPHLGPFTWRTFLPDGRIRELRNVIYDSGLGTELETVNEEPNFFRAVTRFIAEDPVWWGDDHAQTEAPGVSTGIAFIFPLNPGLAGNRDFDTLEFGGGGSLASRTFSITYDGSWPAYPVIQILGPADDMLLTNNTTGEKLELDYEIADGETVTFDTRFGFKTVESDTAGNIVGYLTTDSDLTTFHLEIDPVATDGLNSFTLSAGNTTASTRLTIRWEDRYLAI